MNHERLSEDAVKRISGPSWQPLKQAFLDLSDILLGVAPDTVGVLTTIYVKFQLRSAADAGVFAVVWLKNSKQLVLGLALPDNIESPRLGPAPSGMRYKGITKYLVILPGETLPEELRQWANAAYQNALGEAG
jgi:hypothetical protein